MFGKKEDAAGAVLFYSEWKKTVMQSATRHLYRSSKLKRLNCVAQ
jgi:hypothetical protein